MRFVTLGSGSRGNATLVDCGSTRLLIDQGFSLRELDRRLAAINVTPASLTALLLTHEHADHGKGMAALACREEIDLWTTPGTWRALGSPAVPRLRLLSGHERGLRIGDLRVRPYPVPHDACEPCQFVIEGAGRRLGILTDAGHVTAHIHPVLADCDALMLECNHDEELLRTGAYPPSLKRRVLGDFGHLSNRQAATLLDTLPNAATGALVIAHMSEKNNRPALVFNALASVSGDLTLSAQLAPADGPGSWVRV